MLRLVRDDEPMDVEQMEPPEALDDSDRQPIPVEEPDGAVDDSGQDPHGSEEISVNLALLEAMLLSTHHPLTAGRLAELLDLPTTKSIRRAVKELNEQYAS